MVGPHRKSCAAGYRTFGQIFMGKNKIRIRIRSANKFFVSDLPVPAPIQTIFQLDQNKSCLADQISTFFGIQYLAGYPIIPLEFPAENLP
jgi:hypothetical protein